MWGFPALEHHAVAIQAEPMHPRSSTISSGSSDSSTQPKSCQEGLGSNCRTQNCSGVCVPGAVKQIKKHGDVHVRQPTRVARLYGEHEGCSNDAAVGARDLELVLPVENFSCFPIDLFAGSRKAKIDVVAVEEGTNELLMIAAL